jgi:hypothetical protein
MRAASRMSKNSTSIRIACALCVGSTPERYLGAALASMADVVDMLVVNDNSGLNASPNVAIVRASPLASRAVIIQTQFVDFADMRNRAHAALALAGAAPDWVLFLDADEVHGSQVRYVAREVLPRLSPGVGQVDGYTYHFWGTFDWISDVARRMMFYRYAPALRWENPVHEKLVGLPGRSLVLPYVYHHYGNVLSPELLARKHGKYFMLGNPVPAPPSEATASLSMYLPKAGSVRPYSLPHPLAAHPVLAATRLELRDQFSGLDAAFRSVRRPWASRLAGLNETLRVELRRLQTRFPLPTSAQ